MMLELLLGGILLTSLIFYVLTGGADYGAGIWSMLTRGASGHRQRGLIDSAIAPIWEANHVWLILVITLLFAAFPRAYAVISTTLHIPLTVFLIGVVLRGSAFAFRTNDVEPRNEKDSAQVVWARVFAWSSLLASFMLGMIIGAIASGRLAGRPSTYYSTYVAPWLAPFPLLVGCFAVALFAYLAAMYLILETNDRHLQEDFHTRAVWSGLVVAVLELGILMLSQKGAPEIYEGLTTTVGGHLTVVFTNAVTWFSMLALWRRWYRTARVTAAIQVALIVFGWAMSQYPYLIVPDVTIADAAAPDATLQILLWSLLAGALLLFPSLYYLYWIFKFHTLPSPNQAKADSATDTAPGLRTSSQ